MLCTQQQITAEDSVDAYRDVGSSVGLGARAWLTTTPTMTTIAIGVKRIVQNQTAASAAPTIISALPSHGV